MWRQRFFSLIILVGIAIWPATTLAYQSPGHPTGLVNDFAGMLSVEERTALEAKLNNYLDQSGNEISVVTINSLGDDTIENFAEELFQEWGIGLRGQDNGALLLIAHDDRELRIEVGYGLEPELTDAESKIIIDQIITPQFKEGNYAAGINAGAEAIIQTLGGEGLPVSTERTAPSPLTVLLSMFGPWIFLIPVFLVSILARSKSWWAGGIVGGIIGLILYLSSPLKFLWIPLFVILGLSLDYIISKTYQKSKAAGRTPPWWIGGGGFGSHGRGGGGGFGGFGGGSSGGGGASGRW